MFLSKTSPLVFHIKFDFPTDKEFGFSVRYLWYCRKVGGDRYSRVSSFVGGEEFSGLPNRNYLQSPLTNRNKIHLVSVKETRVHREKCYCEKKNIDKSTSITHLLNLLYLSYDIWVWNFEFKVRLPEVYIYIFLIVTWKYWLNTILLSLKIPKIL